jgi:hypothetical protein
MRQRLLGVGVFAVLACIAVGAQESRSPLDDPTTLRLPNVLPPPAYVSFPCAKAK